MIHTSGPSRRLHEQKVAESSTLPKQRVASASTAAEAETFKLRHVEVFHAVMLTGTVNGAARLLNVTQPAVTKVLQRADARRVPAMAVHFAQRPRSSWSWGEGRPPACRNRPAGNYRGQYQRARPDSGRGRSRRRHYRRNTAAAVRARAAIRSLDPPLTFEVGTVTLGNAPSLNAIKRLRHILQELNGAYVLKDG